MERTTSYIVVQHGQLPVAGARSNIQGPLGDSSPSTNIDTSSRRTYEGTENRSSLSIASHEGSYGGLGFLGFSPLDPADVNGPGVSPLLRLRLTKANLEQVQQSISFNSGLLSPTDGPRVTKGFAKVENVVALALLDQLVVPAGPNNFPSVGKCTNHSSSCSSNDRDDDTASSSSNGSEDVRTLCQQWLAGVDDTNARRCGRCAELLAAFLIESDERPEEVS